MLCRGPLQEPSRRCRGVVIEQRVIGTDLSDWYSFSGGRGTWLQLWPNLTHNLAPTWNYWKFGSNFGPSWGPYVKMGCSRPNPKPSKRPFSLVFLVLFPIAVFPMLCLRQAQLGVKLSLKGPKLRHFGRDLDCSAQLITAKFDPSRLLVRPSRPASFLSVLFPGAGGSLE